LQSANTTRIVWFFDVLFMSKYMELMSQLKVWNVFPAQQDNRPHNLILIQYSPSKRPKHIRYKQPCNTYMPT
jgi:hypothetical protein